MSRVPAPTAVGYFGKIPSRGDFVKGSDNPALIKVLDDWLAFALNLMSGDARWKSHYDSVQPLHFAFLGPRRRRAIAGHIVASHDQSNRRFPFLMMSSMEIVEPATFVPSAPLLLGRLWNRLESLSDNVINAADATGPLQAAASHVIELDLRQITCEAAFEDFLDMQTIGALEAMLAQSGFAGSVREVMLALGLLLSPVLSSASSRLDKSLLLPLPGDPMFRNLAAAFWMHVITPFLARGDFELAMFITRIGSKPVLVLGFSGASAETLSAIMDPVAAAERHVTFDQLDWVEDQAGAGYATSKLAALLNDPTLSLQCALDSLRAAFIGS